MNLDPRIYLIEEDIVGDSDRCSEIIARYLDIDGQDHAWLVNGLADLIYDRDNKDAVAALVKALEQHIGPVITQEAINDLERAEAPADGDSWGRTREIDL